MKIEDLLKMYPSLNERMLNFFLKFALQGTQTCSLSMIEIEQGIKAINPNVIFNIWGIIGKSQSPHPQEDLRVKIFAVRELVMLTALATTYMMKLNEKYKNDTSKIKENLENNVVKVMLDKAEKAMNPNTPKIITDFKIL